MYRLYKNVRDYLGVSRRYYFVDENKKPHLFKDKQEALDNFPTVNTLKELREDWGIRFEKVEEKTT